MHFKLDVTMFFTGVIIKVHVFYDVLNQKSCLKSSSLMVIAINFLLNRYFLSIIIPIILGKCSAFGDPHYKTFDGKWFEFNGICKYILAEEYVTKLFDIVIENVGCNAAEDVSCAKSVSIKLNGSIISLRQQQHQQQGSVVG